MSSALRAVGKWPVSVYHWLMGMKAHTSTVDAVGALLLRAKSNSRAQTNDGGLVLFLTRLGDGVGNRREVTGQDSAMKRW